MGKEDIQGSAVYEPDPAGATSSEPPALDVVAQRLGMDAVMLGRFGERDDAFQLELVSMAEGMRALADHGTLRDISIW